MIKIDESYYIVIMTSYEKCCKYFTTNRVTSCIFICIKIFFSYRCLHKTGGSLQFSKEKCTKIIECCFRLHNKAISERVPLQVGNNAVPVYHNHDLYNGNGNDGFALRQRIVHRF